MRRLRDFLDKLGTRTASGWPGLHITEVHFVLALMAPVYLIALVVPFFIVRTDSVPDVITYEEVTAIICGVLSIAWAARRALTFRLLPVTTGFRRMQWIWLDMLSLAAINGIIWFLPHMLESRTRSIISLADLRSDADYLFSVRDELRYVWGMGSSSLRRSFVERHFAKKAKGKSDAVSEVRESEALERKLNIASTSDSWDAIEFANFSEVVTHLEKYCPRSLLTGPSNSHISVKGFDLATKNLSRLFRIHGDGSGLRFSYGSDQTEALLLLFGGIGLGLVLAVAALPAVGLGGSIGGTIWIGVCAALFALLFIIFDAVVGGRTAEVLGWWALAGVFAITLIVAVAGIFGRRARLWSRMALFACLISAPLISFLVALTFGRLQENRASAHLTALSMLLAFAVLSPLVQLVLNRLHAKPE